jgi:GcrA cell cycle regulator
MSHRRISPEWDEQKIQNLIVLRGEGLSTAEIGKRLRVSPNAVVGKANRLGLEKRPSPILPRLSDEERAKRVRPKRTDALAFLQSVLPLQQPIAPPRTCQWPMWAHNERPGLNPRFCGVRAEAGRPYCKCHWAKAHTPRWEAA